MSNNNEIIPCGICQKPIHDGEVRYTRFDDKENVCEECVERVLTERKRNKRVECI